MSELTLPDAARSNTVKQLDRRNRGNLECKYILFLVQISMQMHIQGFRIQLAGQFSAQQWFIIQCKSTI
jgi:hypothetical protein